MPNGSTKRTLAPSCTQARRISAMRSMFFANEAGSRAAMAMDEADMIRR